jgi:thiamine-phosphate diphosphorylase/hydroxyethylthiazole kinase
VSAIVAAEDPKGAAMDLEKLLEEPPAFAKASAGIKLIEGVQDILKVVPSVIEALGEKSPLSHNMTNLVVQNFAANVALAM